MHDDHDRGSDSLAGLSEVVPGGAPDGPSALGPSPADDPLADILERVRLTGALFFLVEATSPWCVEVPEGDRIIAIILPRAQHVVSYHVVVEGSGFASVPGIEPARFEAGDVIVFPHGDPYLMLSRPGVPPELDLEQTLQFFRDMADGRLPFVVTEGGGEAPPAKFVCGFLGCDARPFNPLLAALPRLMHLRRSGGGEDGLLGRLIDLTLAEAQTRRAGGDSIRVRLSELMFVEVLRRYLEDLPEGETGWLAGLRDPAVGKALALLHARPQDAWGLERLAGEAAVSRSVLAERFAHLVGQPPMHYLTRWRMQLATRLLAERSMTVAAVAEQVGYASEAAFSRAFKKVAGLPPAAWRRRSNRPG